MPGRFAFSIVLTFCVGFSAFAQSYQTSFSDVKFDRAKGPVTFHGGVEVDAASGAASMNLPFGPGIGERGLKFRPVLSMRMAPQLGISSVDENHIIQPAMGSLDAVWGTSTIDTLYQRGFGSVTFSPGTLDLGNLVSTVNERSTSYSLPGGGGGRVLGRVPTGVDWTSVENLLAKFGFPADDTVGYVPGPSLSITKTRFIQVTSSGALVIGLRVAGPEAQITDEIQADIQEAPPSGYRWALPRRMAVIQGDVAYEYVYTGHSYQTRYRPYLAISEKSELDSGHYRISKIRNRLGESIEFTYDADGSGYTAMWKTNPSVAIGPSIRVATVGTSTPAPNLRWLSDSRFNLSQSTLIRVTYQGISLPVSTYLLEVSDPASGGAVAGIWGNDPQPIQPVRVIQEATNEEIRFSYGAAETTNWSWVTIAPTVLTSVAFPTHEVRLTWKAFPFRMNYSPEAWGGMVSSCAPGRPAFAYGVVGVTDSDGAQSRSYSHIRVVPTSNWITEIPSPGSITQDQWVSTTFYDAITHPDGSVSVHRFVEPPNPGSTMQDLAFIKTIEREVRYYLPGVDWNADLSSTDPASSTAYRWVVKDRFDVRSVGAPTGGLSDQAVPYPTRTRIWDKESQILTTEEMTDWDSVAFGWKTIHHTSAIIANPFLSMDYLSLAQQGTGYATYPATLGLYRQTSKTFATSVVDWFIGRVKGEGIVTVEDHTESLAANTALPSVQPRVEKSFNSLINRVESIDLKGEDGVTVTTGFAYQGTSGLQAMQLLNAYLTSPGLVLSGQLGVSSYGYDSNGYLNAISQKPNASTTLSVGQAQDELGRPTSQTDMNGKVQSFMWDPAGRISRIAPPDEMATDITYNDSDHRGITLTRGVQLTELRYNGFGQLVLERRKAPDGAWSYRIHGYDRAGRKTGETIWQQGDGAGHEADWAKDYLLQAKDVTVTTPGENHCVRWTPVADGEPACAEWVYVPGTTTTTHYAALSTGQRTAYDGRGRVISTTDANNINVQTEYFGPGTVRKVTVGAGTSDARTTWYQSDAAGRLAKVTDALNQVTFYRYDGGDRLREVHQVGAAGNEQVRTWNYNSLGWLKYLTQPESGLTAYSGFTVAGKPTITSYAGRIVRMTPDWMGRPSSVSADDGSVTQTFTYDTAVGGAGKLATTQDGSILMNFGYGGAGGRLDNLQTTIHGQAFTQTFQYDAYGQRSGGNTGHAPWAQTYHPETGLPKTLSYNGAVVADTQWGQYDPISWAIRSIRYGNNAVSGFDYDVDQMRLHQIVHSPASGGPLAQWVYQYDQVGNLTREYDLATGSFDKYEYDLLNRLQSALVRSEDFGDQIQSFTYDAFGSRTSSQILAVVGWNGARGDSTPSTTTSPLLNTTGRDVVNVTFDPASSALTQKNQLPATTSMGALTGASYDAQGNLLQVFKRPGDASTLLTMSYDALGRVVSLGRPDGTSERYGYTAEGLRSLIEEWQGSTLVRRKYNLYNDGRQLVSQYEESLSGGAVPAGLQSMVVKTSSKSASKTLVGPASIGTNPVITSPSGSITVYVGNAVLFSGSSPDGDAGTWTFGDGGTASGWSTNHTYATAGTYTATLTTRVPSQGRCLSWGWDDNGNRVCNQYQINWTTQSTSVVITVLPNPPSIVSFTATPTTIAIGGNSTLNWNVSGAASVTLSGSGVGASGSQVVYPSSTTSYTLTATNSGGTTNATVTINVVQAPVISWFSASPTTIYQGDGSTLEWGVSNATALSLDQGIGSVLGFNSRVVSPSGSTTYTLTATNTLNGVSVVRTASANVTVNPRPTVPTISTFSVDSPTIGVGNGTTLRWTVVNGVGDVSVTLSSLGGKPASGSAWVTPGTTTTYTLTATNNLDPSKSVSANVTVTVIQKPVISFSANPTTVNVGNSTVLSWSCTNTPTSVSIDNGVGEVGASGSTAVTPSASTTYIITASNLGGTATAQVAISVTQRPVVVGFTASPLSITKGRSSTLSWSTQGADSATLNGQTVTGGSIVVAPSTSQTYTLVVTNSAGSNSAQVTVTVAESGTLMWKRDIIYLGNREAAEFDGAGMHVTMVDHLGSPRIVTGPTGQLESRQKFLPFGELLDQGAGYIPSKGYTNHEQTDPSGLIYMQARFYLPWMGRFASPDPARDQHFEDTQSWNIYSYVRNRPIMSADPTGMENLLVYAAQNGADGNLTAEYDLINETSAAPAKKDQEAAQTFDNKKMYDLASPITWKDAKGDSHTISQVSGADLNEATRIVYAEAGGLKDGTDKERSNIADVLINRLGAWGIPGGPQSTLTGVAHASGAFESYENNTAKYAAGADPSKLTGDSAKLWNLSYAAVKNELKGGTGVGSSYTSNRAGSRDGWTSEGASRFRSDPSHWGTIKGKKAWIQGIERAISSPPKPGD